MINRYETVYREAAFLLTQKDQNKTSALKIMLDTTKNLADLLGITSVALEQLHKERMQFADDQMKFLSQLTEMKEKVTAQH